MRAAWIVRVRQMEWRFAFWLALIGYNKRDKSIGHRIYLVYALLFMSVWVFAVLTLLAGSGAHLLVSLNPDDPASAAEWLTFLVLTGWACLTLVRYSRRSPFIFTEDDAFLICQTPINRRAVALAWFPADWLETALPFWAIMVTLGFSMAEIGLHGDATALNIPIYVLIGLRALILFLPMQMGILALLWTVGALRLQGTNDPAWVRWSALILALVLLGGLVVNLTTRGLGGRLDAIWKTFYWPAYYPLMAAFGQARWTTGLGLGTIWAVIGLAALWFVSKGLNLSRAAQEARGLAAQQQAIRSGAIERAQEIAARERLGIGHTPSQLPPQSGVRALPWKDTLQSLRTFRLTSLFPWLYVLISALGIALLPGWAPRSLAAAIWCIVAGQAATLRLRNDLARWSILRQLPFKADRLLIANLVAPWSLCLLLTGLGLLSSAILNGGNRIELLVLAPSTTAVVVMVAAYDVLRQCQVSSLLIGASGEVSARGALLAFISAAIPVGLVYWLAGGGFPLEMSVLLGLAISLGFAWIAWRVAAGALRSIE